MNMLLTYSHNEEERLGSPYSYTEIPPYSPCIAELIATANIQSFYLLVSVEK